MRLHCSTSIKDSSKQTDWCAVSWCQRGSLARPHSRHLQGTRVERICLATNQCTASLTAAGSWHANMLSVAMQTRRNCAASMYCTVAVCLLLWQLVRHHACALTLLVTNHNNSLAALPSPVQHPPAL